MNYGINESGSRTRTVTTIIAALLVVALAVGGLFLYLGLSGRFRTENASTDEIRDALLEKDLSSYGSVADALRACGFVIERQRVRDIELIYKYYYYKELPPTAELTRAIGTLYLDNFAETIDSADKSAVTNALLKCFAASVGDPYSFFFTKDEYVEYLSSLTGGENKVGIGVMVEINYESNVIRVSTVIPGAPAEAAGVKKGDIITAVDGVSVSDVGAEALIDLIGGEIGSEVEITVLRGDESVNITAVRNTFTEITVIPEMLAGNIAYIQVTQFKESTPFEFKKAIDDLTSRGAVGIIFDMRNNPGGLLDAVVDMIDYVVEDGQRIASFTMGKQSPTVFYANDGHSIDLPITVLCNGNTASAGELFTAAIRDYASTGVLNGSIVGEVTYKKGVMQTSYTLSDGSAIKLTVAFYNPPSDVNYDGEGVKPDVEVSNDGEDDDQLSAAVAELQRLIALTGNGL